MVQTKFVVKWMKYFVNGNLKGCTYDSMLHFDTLEDATKHMSFLLKHSKTPVKSIGGSDYTCHVCRIETIIKRTKVLKK